MKIIDPHIHLWDLSRGDYQWLSSERAPFWPDKPKLQHNFSVDDLRLSASFELMGVVHIEAGYNNQSPIEEVIWLKNAKNRHSPPMKIIASGDITLAPTDFNQLLQSFAAHGEVVGIRHILDNDASRVLNHPNTTINLARLSSHNMIFETQLLASDIDALQLLAKYANQFPRLTIVIDHMGFTYQGFLQQHFTLLEQFLSHFVETDNVFFKASGWEMKDSHQRQWEIEDVNRFIDYILLKIPSDRLMFASNFPLCLLAFPYQTGWQRLAELNLTPQQREHLFFDTAKRVYFFD